MVEVDQVQMDHGSYRILEAQFVGFYVSVHV